MPHGERSCGKSAMAIEGSCAVAWSKHTASDSAQIRTDVSAGFNRPIDGVSALNVPPFCRRNLTTSGHRQYKRNFTFGASRDARGRGRCGVPIRAYKAPLADIRPDRVAPLV